jgi:hypothetical protein
MDYLSLLQVKEFLENWDNLKENILYPMGYLLKVHILDLVFFVLKNPNLDLQKIYDLLYLLFLIY